MSSLSFEQESIVAGRYRIVTPLGRGASARVYLADDMQLGRRVAIKVLHDLVAEDQQLLKRFRAEALAAAALNHPNVMHVYDSGDEPAQSGPPAPFLVMEFVGGGSLRAVLDAGPLLTPSQALLVGLDAARGLEYAHQHGFVHRDIKPANLLFGEEGRLRIADFGLARALAEGAWTEPEGMLLGTAKYSAPEQALGKDVDGRSDVYSLALVLVEAVTGQVPFARDTPTATLMARCERDLEVPRSLGRLAPVLERAGRRDPDLRPDAGELVIAFYAASEDMDRPAPIKLPGAIPLDELDSLIVRTAEGSTEGSIAGADANNLDLTDSQIVPVTVGAPVPTGLADTTTTARERPVRERHDDDTFIGAADQTEISPLPTIRINAAGAPTAGVVGAGAIKPPLSGERITPASAPTSRAAASPVRSAPTPSADAATVAAAVKFTGASPAAKPTATPKAVTPAPGTESAETDEPTERRPRRWPWVLATLIIIAGIVGGVSYWYLVIRTPTHPVIDAQGMTVDEATRELESLNFTVTTSLIRQDDTEPNEVVGQDPEAGTVLDEEQTVKLIVSLGNTLVAAPAFTTAMDQNQVLAALDAAGLVVGTRSDPFDETIPAGFLISATSAADATGQLPKGSPVDIVISAGPTPRLVPPGLVGQTIEAATALVTAQQLGVNVTEQFNDAPIGTVLAVNQPDNAPVARGTVLEVSVSKGPEPIPIPNVIGMSVTDATATLTAQGFAVSAVLGTPANKIIDVSPKIGELHQRGTSVVLQTSLNP